MVVSQAKDAADAGIAILEAGGNAVDAAVATAFALATVEPWNSGLGGIGFALAHMAGETRAHMVDFGPRAPAGLDAARFKLTGRMKQDLFAWPEVEGDTNIHGPLSFVLPSAVAGYRLLHERWGRLPLREVMAPAVALAQRGLSQDWFTTLKIAVSAAVLRKYPESARIYLPDGLPRVPPYQGVPPFFRLGRLGDTLERLQHAGLQDFYEGDVAASLVRDIAALGGVVTAEDLRGCTAQIAPATELPWGAHIAQLAGGLTAAGTLARVRALMHDAPRNPAPDADWYRHLSRSMKQAYAERLARAGENEPSSGGTCTTHLTVCDAEGSMVAMTTTLLSSMGSRVVLPGSGVLMNNGVMWFDPRPNQPNSISPGRRPLTNMCPVIVRSAETGAPWLGVGASGGRRILASVAQVLSYVLDFSMSPEDAIHHPRIDVSDPNYVTADRRLGTDIIAALQLEGRTELVDPAVLPINFACPNLIWQEGGQRTGVSDVDSPWSAAIAEPDGMR
jgi:gamma-glutamyltranspeptidase/glutathione hydrolase